jgi:hypothetical protein
MGKGTLSSSKGQYTRENSIPKVQEERNLRTETRKRCNRCSGSKNRA